MRSYVTLGMLLQPYELQNNVCYTGSNSDQGRRMASFWHIEWAKKPASLQIKKKKIVIVNIYWERLPNSFLFTVHWTLTMLKCEWCNSTNFIEVTKLRHRWSGLPKFTDLVRRNPNSESESRGCTPKQSVVYNSNFKYSAPRSIMACFCFFIWKIWPVTDRIYGIMIFWREGRGRGKLWWSVSSVQKLKRRSRETLYWLTNTSEVGHRLHFGILVPANSICAVYIKGLFI